MMKENLNGVLMPKEKKLMITCFIKFKEYLLIFNIQQDRTFHQAPFVLLTNLLESLLTLWCSKTCKNLYQCSLTDLKKEWKNILWETWFKTFTLEKQQIFLNVTTANKPKKLKKTFIQYHCKLRIQRIYQNHSIDMLWERL